MELLNLGLKFMNIDEKIVRMILETKPSNINEIVILPAVKIFMKKILNKLQNKKVYGRIYNGLLNGVKVSVNRSLVGCPNAAMAMECFKRSNVKIVIRVDFCGGIGLDNNSINIGEVLIPKLSYCGDGTSPYYIINHSELQNQLMSIPNPISKVQEINTGNQMVYSSKPDDKLTELLFSEATSILSKRSKAVDFWTTDALFCETDDFINSLKSLEVQGIDMENSILFLLGQLYNLRVASVLSVSDLPGDPKYDMLKSNSIHPDMEKGINDAIKIMISALPKIKALLIE